MSDVSCPYCEAGQDINHDDGYGYGEDEIFEQACVACDMVFAFTTFISLHYNVKKADCLNGGEHDYRETMTVPRRYTKLECRACGDRQPITRERVAELEATT